LFDTDAKAKADPANKKMMKEELKEKKERVKIFKENTKNSSEEDIRNLLEKCFTYINDQLKKPVILNAT
jgi:hypothetical protein